MQRRVNLMPNEKGKSEGVARTAGAVIKPGNEPAPSRAPFLCAPPKNGFKDQPEGVMQLVLLERRGRRSLKGVVESGGT